MNIRLLIVLMLLSSIGLGSQPMWVQDNAQPEGSGRSGFALAGNGSAADVLVDAGDSKTVHLAARLFSEDIERVSGLKASLKQEIASASSRCVIVGTLDHSRFIKRLIQDHKIDVTDIERQWESCLIQVIDNPFNGIERALVVAGSDRRGAAYGLLELSKQMGVSPWVYFADVPPKKRDAIMIKAGRFIQASPSVKYRGIFINDEMWGLRPWAMNTLAPAEGKGIGPTTYRKVFELLLRLKANFCWPAMHQQTKPFNFYEDNRVVADEYGIVMGSSHIEPMLRNNMGGAEWDQEYPGEPWDYVKNKAHIYEYWEKRARENGEYENVYTLGKRGKDDEAGSDITVPVLEEIFADQRAILKKWVNPDITKVPQVLVPYTEVLGLYNKGLKVPDDVIICWPDDNFGNIRQLPNQQERQRSGGSGIYYHFQWLNGATSAYPWLYTSPLALTWTEMKKAYDYNVRDLWVVNVGDIKPAEIGIEHFMQMAWDISAFQENDPMGFLKAWATRDFGEAYASRIAGIMTKHFELGYARRPEHMVMYVGRTREYTYDWFSVTNYNDEAQQRVDAYDQLMRETDAVYESLPAEKKDAFFQMVAYNVKGAALHNKKVIYAQKSNAYAKQNRASATVYAAMAQQAEQDIKALIRHYNTELITVGAKWNHMASLPGPWGAQWQQWAMPPLGDYPGNDGPAMNIALEGGDDANLPGFSVYNKDTRFIDLYNTGNGVVNWSARTSADWIQLSESSGTMADETRVWVTIDWATAPRGAAQDGHVTFAWSSSSVDVWTDYDAMSETERAAFRAGTLGRRRSGNVLDVALSVFNPQSPSIQSVTGFVESHGYISMEAEHYSRKVDKVQAAWHVLEGLGRTGNSVTVLPTDIPGIVSLDDMAAKSPLLQYDVYTFSEGQVEISFNCIPSNPINADHGVRLAVSIDQARPVMASRTGRNVIDNLMTLKAKLDMPKQGQHQLNVWMVDPGVVIDKIIMDTGGVKDSYLGPPESMMHPAGSQ
ncbi:MAG: glycosyl hydrolase 115 family protein [Phycisphaerae bacterium]|nr:glycosyl hydrolase 115 family protein [Phycisphaerae bacterium]